MAIRSEHSQRSTRPRFNGLRVISASLLAATVLMGCKTLDTRMSVQDFLALQADGEVTTPAGQPTTQPVAAKMIPWTAGSYKVGPADVIRVTIAGLEVLSTTGVYQLRVNEQGAVLLDTVGLLPVAGLTLDEIEKKIHDAYVPKYIRQTQVTAEMISFHTIDVIVLGEVRLPAPVELRSDKDSVLHAILAAGGPTEVADGRITLLHATSPDKPIVFNISQRADLARAARSDILENSDVIIVERGVNDFVFVQGLVNVPGPVPMPNGTRLSILQAIAAAGGTLHAFAPKEATLMRHSPDGDLIRVRLDLHRLALGEDPDLVLASGDVVLVPHTSDTRFEEFLARTLFFRAGVDATFNPWTYYFFQKDIDVREDAIGAGGGFFDTSGRLGLFDVPTPTPAP